jgi:transposase
LHDEQERLAALSPDRAVDPPPDAFPAVPLERPGAGRAVAQQRRQERYAAVQELRGQGLSIAEVARRLHLARKTVRRLAAAATCPARVPRRHLLAPFEPYLRYRWAQGCRNARALFDELRARGYRGSYPHLRHALRGWRDQPARHGLSAGVATPPPPELPSLRPISPRQARWLLLGPAEDLDDGERAFLRHLLALCPEIHTIQDLAQRFCTLVRERDAAALEPWLCATEAEGCAELRGFAEGVRRDRAAVDAALTLAWSQGPTEGKVNKLKVLKRSAFGRSAFDLLRIRVLHAA